MTFKVQKKLIQKSNIILHHDKQGMLENIKYSDAYYYYCIAMVTEFDTPLLPILLNDMHSCRHEQRTFLTALLWPWDI